MLSSAFGGVLHYYNIYFLLLIDRIYNYGMKTYGFKIMSLLDRLPSFIFLRILIVSTRVEWISDSPGTSYYYEIERT